MAKRRFTKYPSNYVRASIDSSNAGRYHIKYYKEEYLTYNPLDQSIGWTDDSYADNLEDAERLFNEYKEDLIDEYYKYREDPYEIRRGCKISGYVKIVDNASGEELKRYDI